MDKYKKSYGLLKNWLSKEELIHFKVRNEFRVIGGKSGDVYVISPHWYLIRYKKRWLFRWLEPKEINYCIGFMDWGIPDCDRLLALKVLIEGDERMIWKIGNRLDTVGSFLSLMRWR